ncbi:MAG: cell surface protein SprA, partial [Siphonobacter sp.]
MRFIQPVWCPKANGEWLNPWTSIHYLVRVIFFLCVSSMAAEAQQVSADSTQQDSLLIRTKTGKRPLLKVPDRLATRFSYTYPQSPLIPRDPKNLQTDFRYEPTDQKISVSDQFQTGSDPISYRIGEKMSIDEYLKIQNDAAYRETLREYAARSDGKSDVTGRGLFPKIKLTDSSLDRIFGSSLIDFLPNGSVMLDMGYMHQNIENPNIPVRQRRTGNFIFNEQIAINFAGKIGDKLNLNTNFDTKAAFNFENKLKLGFKNQEEDIIQKIEAGNTSFRTNTQFMPGVDNLFGANVAMRFGKLDVNIVAAQQRSKRQSITLKNGALNRSFSIREDLYEENRHFFLSQFFRTNYERALQQLPVVNSGISVTRVEVYVTNRAQSTTTLRNIVGLTDMGEGSPYNTSSALVQPISGDVNSPASNANNGVYANVTGNSQIRLINNVTGELQNNGYTKGVDFDVLRRARKLGDNEFTFNAQLGYISLLTPIRNDEVIAVSFEYSYRGKSYQVGELTEDYQNRDEDEVIVLKLLRSSTIRNHTDIPLWDLMMKNIYSLNTQTTTNSSAATTYTSTATGVQQEGFQLRVVYKDDATGIDNPTLQESGIKNIPLIQIMGLDKLNQMNDQQADGNFDFVSGVTIDADNGRVIFPVLEPFGSHLQEYITEPQLADKYVNTKLYRNTQVTATQQTAKNKFYLTGSYQGKNSSSIALPYGVDESSVQVIAGGVALTAGSDYTVESGAVKFINETLLTSGKEITISYETPDLFNNQIRTLIAGRFDYHFSNDITLGATFMHLKESTPGNLLRVAVGNEPVNNFMYGTDLKLKKNAPWLTRALDGLPLVETKEMSNIAFSGEYAQLIPGVNNRVKGRSYIDDFEASRTVYDFTKQPIKWRLGATPEDYSSATSADPLGYAYKRARVSVYSIDQTFYGTGGSSSSLVPSTLDVTTNYFEKQYLPQQIFTGKSYENYNLPLSTLDIAYFPSERGQYNYTTNLTQAGLLKNPTENFGAITRAITSDTDFENANIETIEFWVMDPFIDVVRNGSNPQKNTSGGKLLIHIGDISEDVTPDGLFTFENGFPVDGRRTSSVNGQAANVDSSAWGYAPLAQYVINAFDNSNISVQDIGFDGLNDTDEQTFFKSYLSQIQSVVTGDALTQIQSDPSNDDFKYYFSTEADQNNWSIIERYKNYMGMENNSPTTTINGVTPASTNLPDSEDLNTDNTVNETESYYEYEVPILPGQLEVGSNNIVDKITTSDGSNWYLFRVDIKTPTRAVGGISDLSSMRFMRLVLTGFAEPVVLRFAQFQLTGYQYRKYTYDLNATSEVAESYDADFLLSTVNIEENGPGASSVGTIPYVVPPGYDRDRDITTLNNAQLNEQSLKVSVTDLHDGDSRAVYKLVNYDLTQYKRINMSVHMENTLDEDGKTSAFMRLGTDFLYNYYEIEVLGLTATKASTINIASPDASLVWPTENKFDFAMDELRQAKADRNRSGASITTPYTVVSSNGKYKITIMGNPDFSAVQILMLGMRNPKSEDGQSKSFTLWLDELHTTGYDQTAGFAAVAKADIKLADVGLLTLSSSIKTYGFGDIQSRISERSRDNTFTLGVASTLNLEKFFPQKWGLQIPFYFSYDKQTIRPHFNPLDPDMPLELSLSTMPESQRAAYRRMVEDNTTQKAMSFSNVRKIRLSQTGKMHFYDIENFSFTYAYSEKLRSNISMAEYYQLSRTGGFTYAFTTNPKSWQPFKKWKNERHIFQLIKDFNFTPLPNSIAFQGNMDRSFIKTQYYNSTVGSTAGTPSLTTEGTDPLYQKYWLFNRIYGAGWNFSKSWAMQYSANAQAIIDEPYGAIDTQVKRDSVLKNLLRLGRMKTFTQAFRNTWQIPLNKFPLTDWMQANLQYNVSYKFQANSYDLRDSLGVLYGNTIQNQRERVLNGRIDFVALYNKIKALRWVNSPRAPRRDIARSPGDFEEVPEESSQFLKSLARLLLTVRGIQYNYSVLESTILPGFIQTPHFFGDRAGVPGMPFILGSQKGDIRYRGAREGWISKTTAQNQAFVQTITRRFSATTTLEPWKDFTVQMEMNWNRSDNYQEYFRPATAGGAFESQTPVRSGSYSMSYLSFLTAFEKTTRDNYSANFERFQNYRQIILDRLQIANPYGDAYNTNSQDVLIPAFFAAYSGKSPDRVKFSPFYKIPLPNWDLTYRGLTNVPWFKKRFDQIQIKHKYTSTYNVGSFVSSLDYDAAFVALNAPLYPFAEKLNDEGQFIPVYVMSVISFVERFAPFIGVQVRTKDGITGGLEYNQDRNVGLNLSNVSVNEVSNKELAGRLGFTKQNIRFRFGGRQVKLKNDVTFDCRLAYRDQRVLIRELDGDVTPTAGNIYFQFNPSVSYTASKQLSVRV